MGFAMVERTADCDKIHENVVRLIYLCLGTHAFFWHFTFKKSSGFVEKGCLCEAWEPRLAHSCRSSGVERTNHEATAPPTEKGVLGPKFFVYRGKEAAVPWKL